MASRAAGIEPPLDTVWADLRDAEGFARSAERAAALGFQGKMCIHPDQIAVANAAFSPIEQQLLWAKRVIAAFDAAEANGPRLDPVRWPVHRLSDRAARARQVVAREPHDVRRASPGRLPGAGCRVSFLAGPFCATQLGEFGADVIKVELPGVGDATRRFGTMTECGDSLPWLSESRNKKLHHAGSAQARWRRADQAAGRGIRCAGRELSAGHLGELGPRLGRAAARSIRG